MITSLILVCGRVNMVWSQNSEGVDTTSTGYQIGYQIGSYLPVAIILLLAIMVIARSYRLGKEKDQG